MIRCERATVERSGRVVVESLTLAVAPGQAVAVVGRTGSGKSSLLAAVATVLPLHAGEILVDGKVLTIEMPVSVELTIVETDPIVRGASATSRTKPAKLQTGLVVQVPEYITTGERIKVDTRTGEFTKRA